jgi:protein-export membrane protein SecD
MDFKTDGARMFEEITGENIGKRMAVILDGNVYSAPTIQARIGGGRAQITLGGGGFNSIIQEARDLALVLRAGALPVELQFLEQRTVGPSLGADSIVTARTAGLIGCALVFLFIMIYYRLSGVVAMVCLTVNVLVVLAILVGLEATLTLPGIAGIALTVGMAVDANIIIYERIREEIRKGVSNFKAVDGGFDQAFWTIIDANITTALAGFMLLNFGTGPIRGFAVTLLIGIAATVYTSYFVGKMIFEFYMNKTEGQDLSI